MPDAAALDRIKGSTTPLITPIRNSEVDYETYAKRLAA